MDFKPRTGASARGESAADLCPGNGLDGSAIELRHAPVHLGCPQTATTRSPARCHGGGAAPSCIQRSPGSTARRSQGCLRPSGIRTGRSEPTEALHGLVDAIVLKTDQPGETLQIELSGNLAAMLGETVQTKRSSESDDLSLQLALVAGACNHRYLQLWSAVS